MQFVSQLPAILRGLHILSVCAWLGGGLGVILLLLLGRQTESAAELQAYNLVITAIDRLLISPGAAGTVITGLLLARVHRRELQKKRCLLSKLAITAVAISYGAVCLAPCLKELLAVSQLDGLAVFDDLAYLRACKTCMTGSLLQMTMLMGILWVSVANRVQQKRSKPCCDCQAVRTSPRINV